MPFPKFHLHSMRFFSFVLGLYPATGKFKIKKTGGRWSTSFAKFEVICDSNSANSMDSSKIPKEMGWKPIVQLNDGIQLCFFFFVTFPYLKRIQISLCCHFVSSLSSDFFQFYKGFHIKLNKYDLT